MGLREIRVDPRWSSCRYRVGLAEVALSGSLSDLRLDSDPGPSVQSQVAVLCNAIAPILNGLPPTIPYQTVSSTCYRLVSPPNMMGAEIYQRIDQEMTKHLTSFVRNYMLDSGSKEGSWLVHLMAGWKQWEERVVSPGFLSFANWPDKIQSLLSAVFVYLDRIYCDQHSDVLSLK